MTFDPLAQLFDGFNTTARPGNRSRPALGIGIYALETYGPKNTDKGVIMSASLRCVKTPNENEMKVGEQVELAWFIYKSAKEGGENEKARGRDFVNALLGRAAGTPAGEDTRKLSDARQPGRGVLVQIKGEDRSWRSKDGTRSGTTTNYSFTTIPAANQDIPKQRAWVESLAPVETAPAPVQTAQPAAQPFVGQTTHPNAPGTATPGVPGGAAGGNTGWPF